MKKTLFFFILIISISCSQSNTSQKKSESNSLEKNKGEQENLPTKIALEFINAYVENCNKIKGSVRVEEWVNSNKLTTKSFKSALKKLMEEAYKIDPEMGLDADPIFDAQDYPDNGFELESFDSKTNYVVVKGKNWPDFKVTFVMKEVNGKWLIDGCGMINIQSLKTNYQVSTYDNPKFADIIKDHRESLRNLSEQNVFASIANKVLPTIPRKHQAYFKLKSNYELLSAAKGDIFQEHKNDFIFIAYDKNFERLSILIYNENINKYFELYRDFQVENGLENVDCNYSSFGTLDFQLADEIVYLEDYLIKKPESLLENTLCKITNISKDENFILESGCFSKNISKSKLPNSICIATSLVYNNWECLKYEKERNSFLIFYGQAFAD